jgi:hypothetical protein
MFIEKKRKMAGAKVIRSCEDVTLIRDSSKIFVHFEIQFTSFSLELWNQASFNLYNEYDSMSS